MPERHFVANSMTQAIAKVSMDRGIFKISMETAVAASVTAELATWGTLWLMSCRRVSTSLVYTDMISPWAWVSKYLMGRDSILVNSSTLSRFMVPWLTVTMILLYA